MSHLLWKHYWEDDVDKFRRLLTPAGHGVQASKSPNLNSGSGGGSPGAFSSSPRLSKSRKASGFGAAFPGSKHAASTLGRAEVNSRDHAGLTVLLRAASSTSENAIAFVQALLDHPSLDLYAQDPESGWNALHRSLYAGNVSIARLLLEKERKDLTGQTLGASVSRVGQLIKTKDHEGNSPFDLYSSSIGERVLKVFDDMASSDDGSEDEDAYVAQANAVSASGLHALLDGDELFTFGSNKNLNLGLGDNDDRQYPERVYLKRPDHLLQRFHNEYLQEAGLGGSASTDLSNIPAMVLNRPLLIHDVQFSKLSSAVITSDPVSNLYVCGIGRGGRLGLGDENTRFHYAPVQGGLAEKKVVQVALGQNHSMAVTDTGELWTWGSNAHSQLGYNLPPPAKADEEPISATPRQVFGPLKKEAIVGVAASSIHSVAHNGSALFCWGKNQGQLALMDADSRSLESQPVPRRVAASLFSSPILMVSAIDKATTVLLANHTVCVFTGYGYNIVKFPFPETFINYHLPSVSASSRYEAARNQIQYIASGGETIAAVTGRGDLFTMNLNHTIEANQTAATSTTNPSKIKGAVTQPQCIWSARKDGVRSVGVGEHGSVIISTQSGAVWRRVKRAKAKDAYVAGTAEVKRKDFKFQRVPYVTKVTTVRASPFGAFATVRRDCEVMKEQISVGAQTLWDDIAPLNCLHDFTATEPSSKDKDNLAFWNADLLKEKLGSAAYEILRSPDLDADLERHLVSWKYGNDDLDAAVCTSGTPEVKIPVHGWLLAARSVALRTALARYRSKGHSELSDTFVIREDAGKPLIIFQGLDLMSVLNLVLFMYEDKVIPAWNFTRQAPPLAYRYRQIRTEVMRVATRLNMATLEAAARIMTDPERSMADDLKAAIKQRSFFEDGDAVLELDGAEIPVHSALLCQRCPWFEGLFHGRSRGGWLAGRLETQDASDKIRIDLKHIEPDVFKYVLFHLYADIGTDLFEPVVLPSLDDLSDLVMDVLSVANELMLDRLSQICQQILGKFVNTRVISHLLNAISPCSVSDFKDAGLEYICLQVETMLENHLLDDLDEDLLLELDEVVRDNQAAQFPFAKSGRAELLLHEKYPELAQDIDEERQRRVKEMAFKITQKEDERKLSSSFKGKYGSLDDFAIFSSSPDRARRLSKVGRNEPFSPNLRPKESQADLMFDMDEEEDSSTLSSPLVRAEKSPAHVGSLPRLEPLSPSIQPWRDSKGRVIASNEDTPVGTPPTAKQRLEAAVNQGRVPAASPRLTPAKGGSPWAPAAIPITKLDLGELIKSESSTTKHSALSASLAAQKSSELSKTSQPKLSQKERKKQQQAQAALVASQPAGAQETKAAWQKPSSSDAQASPWKVAQSRTKPATPEVISNSGRPSPQPLQPPALLAVESSAKSIPRRTASPDTRFSGQSRMASPATTPAGRPPPQKMPSSPSVTPLQSKPLVPHSKTYISPPSKAEPILGVSMADIMGQQKREQEVVKEAIAKRSLQEIQQEQAFQEWWDAESKRAQGEEARRLVREKDKDERGAGAGGRGGRRGGRSGKPRGGAAAGAPGRGGGSAAGGSREDLDDTGTRDESGSRRGKGRSAGANRGNRGGKQPVTGAS